jgi:lipid A disaccharide synthetase
MEDASDRKHKYFRADNSIEIHPFGIFIIKEQRFITQLYAIPELIDYKTLFPDILNKECKINKIQQDDNGDKLLLFFLER